MKTLKEYIQERIETLKGEINVLIAKNNLVEASIIADIISELQAVLSKLEELGK